MEELGGMNLFFVFADGSLQTPPLTGTILPGITRDSVIKLAERAGRRVEQRPVSFEDFAFHGEAVPGPDSVGRCVVLPAAQADGCIPLALLDHPGGAIRERHRWISKSAASPSDVGKRVSGQPVASSSKTGERSLFDRRA